LKKLGKLFVLIGDSKQHGLNELAEKLNLRMEILKEAVEILARYGLVLCDEGKGIIRLNPEWNFLIENCEENEEASLA